MFRKAINFWCNYDDNYLMHYGVKGMKWGVRHDPVRNSARRQYKADKKNAYKRLMKTSRKLKREGRQNDMNAVNKMAKRYDDDMKRAKQNYKKSKNSKRVANPAKKLANMHRESLRQHNYKRWSRGYNPVTATIKANKDSFNYQRQTTEIARNSPGVRAKGKTYVNRWWNEPVTVMGVTGSTRTTRGKYLTMRIPGGGLY